MGKKAHFYVKSSDFEAQFEDELQGLLRSVAVIFFLTLGQFIVRYEAWMLLEGVVAHGAVGPAFGHAVLCPYLMHILCHFLYEGQQLVWQLDIRSVYGSGDVFIFLHNYCCYILSERASPPASFICLIRL